MKAGIVFSLALPHPPLSPHLAKVAVPRRPTPTPVTKTPAGNPAQAIGKASKAASRVARKLYLHYRKFPVEPFCIVDLFSDSDFPPVLVPESESMVIVWLPSNSAALDAEGGHASVLHSITSLRTPSTPQHKSSSSSRQLHPAVFLDKLVGLRATGGGTIRPLSFAPADVRPFTLVGKLDKSRQNAFITEALDILNTSLQVTFSVATPRISLPPSTSMASISDGLHSYITARSGINFSQSYTGHLMEPRLEASATVSTSAKQSFVTAPSAGNWSISHSTSAVELQNANSAVSTPKPVFIHASPTSIGFTSPPRTATTAVLPVLPSSKSFSGVSASSGVSSSVEATGFSRSMLSCLAISRNPSRSPITQAAAAGTGRVKRNSSWLGLW
ncbi:hypothetical protein OF83DRAFT_434781 [Amylostereum chailletii]|nr:hypothetical protein OF83DRAFT_434781 [Amylostereum chailletii]